jgi:hypothetical protein
MEDFGCAWREILFATTLVSGPAGWWHAQPGRLCRKIGLNPEELMPAISPVGYPAEKKSLTDRAFRFMAKSDKRKPWQELFFDVQPGNPLAKENAGVFGPVLESVRIGPSASNRQPWRIIRQGAAFHFFLARTPGYDKMLGEVRLQEVDMGIALCHFELAASELGIGELAAGETDATRGRGICLELGRGINIGNDIRETGTKTRNAIIMVEAEYEAWTFHCGARLRAAGIVDYLRVCGQQPERDLPGVLWGRTTRKRACHPGSGGGL